MKKAAGFGIVGIILIIVTVALVGVVGWRVYEATKTSPSESNQTNEPSPETPTPEPKPQPKPSNLITRYFPPANISFDHDKKWDFDDSALEPGYFNGSTNQRFVKLTQWYKDSGEIKTRYSITFDTNTKKPQFESYINRFENLGKVEVGNQTLYILRAYLDPGYVGGDLDEIVTSACSNKQCPFKLKNNNLYLTVTAVNSVHDQGQLQESMVPKIVKILKSMKLGKG